MWLREDGTPYYVGKGHGTRAYKSDKGHRPPKDINCILVQEFSTEEEAFCAEIFLISYYGRHDTGEGRLINRTDGGDGPAGHIMSIKQRLSIGDNNRSRVWTKEALHNLSKAKLGFKMPRPWSEEHRKAIGNASRGRIKTTEEIRKHSEALRGKKRAPFSDETRRKLSIAARNRPPRTHTVETLLKIGAARKIAWDEWRLKHGRTKGCRKRNKNTFVLAAAA
jgi:hypothetical protein